MIDANAPSRGRMVPEIVGRVLHVRRPSLVLEEALQRTGRYYVEPWVATVLVVLFRVSDVSTFHEPRVDEWDHAVAVLDVLAADAAKARAFVALACVHDCWSEPGQYFLLEALTDLTGVP